MHVVRESDAIPYDPPGHREVLARRLQGLDAGGPDTVTVGVSSYPPGAGVDSAPTATETVYVVLSGELLVTADEETVILRALDSAHLPQGQVRSVRNDSGADATLLVVMVTGR